MKIVRLPPELEGTGITARVIATRTADNLFGFTHQVRVGDEYRVYPKFIQEVEAYNMRYRQRHKKLIIWADSTTHGAEGFIPVECLDWMTKDKDVRLAQQVI